MRALVIALALLAGLKIWTTNTLHQTASEHALLKAYAAEAATACQKQQHRSAPIGAKSTDWTRYRSAKVIIGDQQLDVALWQVDHEHWDLRFKTPFIHLKTGAETDNTTCIFNVMTGSVSVLRA